MAEASLKREEALASVDDISDAALVTAALKGDARAEGVLLRRYTRDIARLITRLLQDESEVEDLTQETLMIALGKLDCLRDPSAFRSWLLRIAVNRVRMTIRRRRLLRALGLLSSDSATLEALAAPELGAEARAELALIDDVLKRVSTNARIAWMLRYVEGYKLEEVAKACGCSLATAKRRIKAAHDRVRAHVRFED